MSHFSTRFDAKNFLIKAGDKQSYFAAGLLAYVARNMGGVNIKSAHETSQFKSKVLEMFTTYDAKNLNDITAEGFVQAQEDLNQVTDLNPWARNLATKKQKIGNIEPHDLQVVLDIVESLNLTKTEDRQKIIVQDYERIKQIEAQEVFEDSGLQAVLSAKKLQLYRSATGNDAPDFVQNMLPQTLLSEMSKIVDELKKTDLDQKTFDVLFNQSADIASGRYDYFFSKGSDAHKDYHDIQQQCRGAYLNKAEKIGCPEGLNYLAAELYQHKDSGKTTYSKRFLKLKSKMLFELNNDNHLKAFSNVVPPLSELDAKVALQLNGKIFSQNGPSYSKREDQNDTDVLAFPSLYFDAKANLTGLAELNRLGALVQQAKIDEPETTKKKVDRVLEERDENGYRAIYKNLYAQLNQSEVQCAAQDPVKLLLKGKFAALVDTPAGFVWLKTYAGSLTADLIMRNNATSKDIKKEARTKSELNPVLKTPQKQADLVFTAIKTLPLAEQASKLNKIWAETKPTTYAYRQARDQLLQLIKNEPNVDVQAALLTQAFCENSNPKTKNFLAMQAMQIKEAHMQQSDESALKPFDQTMQVIFDNYTPPRVTQSRKSQYMLEKSLQNTVDPLQKLMMLNRIMKAYPADNERDLALKKLSTSLSIATIQNVDIATRSLRQEMIVDNDQTDIASNFAQSGYLYGRQTKAELARNTSHYMLSVQANALLKAGYIKQKDSQVLFEQWQANAATINQSDSAVRRLKSNALYLSNTEGISATHKQKVAKVIAITA